MTWKTGSRGQRYRIPPRQMKTLSRFCHSCFNDTPISKMFLLRDESGEVCSECLRFYYREWEEGEPLQVYGDLIPTFKCPICPRTIIGASELDRMKHIHEDMKHSKHSLPTVRGMTKQRTTKEREKK
jgi:hypothetical protein